MAKKERYYEGTTSSNTIVRDIAKVLCVGVQDDPIVDSDGTVLKKKQLIKERNWDIAYPHSQLDSTLYDENGNKIVIQDKSDLTSDEQLAKINQQLNYAKDLEHDRIILKTKTTPVEVNEVTEDDSLGLENDLNKDSIEMYLEIYKPKYLIDLENYNPETEINGVDPALTTIEGFKDSVSTTGEKTINVYEEYFGTNKLYCEPDYKPEIDERIMNRAEDYMSDKIANAKTGIYKIYQDIGNEFGVPISTADYSNKIINDMVYSSITDPEKKRIVDEIINNSSYKFKEQDKITIEVIGNDTTLVDNYKNNPRLYINIFKTEYQQKFAIEEYDDTTSPESGFYINIPEENPEKFVIDSSNGDLSSQFEYIESSKRLVARKDFPITKDPENLFDGLSGFLEISYEYKKEKATLKKTELVENHHNMFFRIFDKLNDAKDGPEKRSGESHVSEWSKLSWYRDFEELSIDKLDEDPSEDDISQGVISLPTTTPGLNGNTRIQFWVNTSNDTVSLVVMGNPSLEFGANKHISSFAYIGRVKSFDNSINDTAGNFALATSSTTVPCLSKTTTKIKTSEERYETLDDGIKQLQSYTNTNIYNFDLKTPDEFNYEMSTKVLIIDSDTNGNPDVSNINTLDPSKYNIKLPKDLNTKSIEIELIKNEYQVPVGSYIGIVFYTNKEIIETSKGAIRDNLGNIIKINKPDTYGINTATGVTDVAMLHTRSKAYFQKHHLMFTTTNEFMKKEQYGKSAYTNEYYADRCKVVHGNDGPRGMLKNILIIDTASLVALDDLVINKEHKKQPEEPEETFVYFPISAPYSPLTTGPNSMYGIAIKKKEVLPEPKDDDEAIARAKESLFLNNTGVVTDDLYLPEEGKEGTSIMWSSSDSNTVQIDASDQTTNNYDAVSIGKVTRPTYDPDINNDEIVTLTAEISKGTGETVTKEFELTVKESGMTDDASVTNDLDWISIPTTTNQNLNLPKEGPNDTNISWDCSTATSIENDGTITRPDNGDEDITESISATVTKGSSTSNESFEVTIEAWTDSEELQLDYEYLKNNDFSVIAGDNITKSDVVKDLNLVTTLTRGSTVTWSSSDETTIDSTTGTVTRPAYNDISDPNVDGQTITLTATITKDSIEEKIHQITGIVVTKLDKTDQENIYNATEYMNIDDVVSEDDTNGNEDKDSIIENFELPSSPEASWDATGATYSWVLCDIDGNTTDENDNEITYNSFDVGSENSTENVYPVNITRPTNGSGNETVHIKRITTSNINQDDGASTAETQEDQFTFKVLEETSA